MQERCKYYNTLFQFSVGIETKLQAGFDSWQGQKDFSLFHNVQTGSGAHTVYYTMRKDAVSRGGGGRGVELPLTSI
jgi:uncharacterized protein YjlB